MIRDLLFNGLLVIYTIEISSAVILLKFLKNLLSKFAKSKYT